MIPKTDEFRDWVSTSLKRLNMRPSHFLLDGTPGEKNRASRALAARSIKLDVARELQSEIKAAAVKKKIELPSLGGPKS